MEKEKKANNKQKKKKWGPDWGISHKTTRSFKKRTSTCKKKNTQDSGKQN